MKDYDSGHTCEIVATGIGEATDPIGANYL